jgi:hypothetical protein|tara:strand:- start:190 stop:501 length:312 start_codon:yes stop_codon:yes gene_type:complete
MELTITTAQMCKDINSRLTGMAEAITCSGEHSLKEGWYTLFDDWKAPCGKLQRLSVHSSHINEGYNSYNSSRMNSFFSHERFEGVYEPVELVELVWKRLKHIN